ncbi:hypothetical protein K474DRAFT_1698578 [Panus rudis PR-1116 ss-1]|nr:hypothetical protein K474DRAFT_1698578 [Panus rudis PR-1116 ss-1]
MPRCNYATKLTAQPCIAADNLPTSSLPILLGALSYTTYDMATIITALLSPLLSPTSALPSFTPLFSASAPSTPRSPRGSQVPHVHGGGHRRTLSSPSTSLSEVSPRPRFSRTSPIQARLLLPKDLAEYVIANYPPAKAMPMAECIRRHHIIGMHLVDLPEDVLSSVLDDHLLVQHLMELSRRLRGKSGVSKVPLPGIREIVESIEEDATSTDLATYHGHHLTAEGDDDFDFEQDWTPQQHSMRATLGNSLHLSGDENLAGPSSVPFIVQSQEANSEHAQDGGEVPGESTEDVSATETQPTLDDLSIDTLHLSTPSQGAVDVVQSDDHEVFQHITSEDTHPFTSTTDDTASENMVQPTPAGPQAQLHVDTTTPSTTSSDMGTIHSLQTPHQDPPPNVLVVDPANDDTQEDTSHLPAMAASFPSQQDFTHLEDELRCVTPSYSESLSVLDDDTSSHTLSHVPIAEVDTTPRENTESEEHFVEELQGANVVDDPEIPSTSSGAAPPHQSESAAPAGNDIDTHVHVSDVDIDDDSEVSSVDESRESSRPASQHGYNADTSSEDGEGSECTSVEILDETLDDGHTSEGSSDDSLTDNEEEEQDSVREENGTIAEALISVVDPLQNPDSRPGLPTGPSSGEHTPMVNDTGQYPPHPDDHATVTHEGNEDGDETHLPESDIDIDLQEDDCDSSQREREETRLPVPIDDAAEPVDEVQDLLGIPVPSSPAQTLSNDSENFDETASLIDLADANQATSDPVPTDWDTVNTHGDFFEELEGVFNAPIQTPELSPSDVFTFESIFSQGRNSGVRDASSSLLMERNSIDSEPSGDDDEEDEGDDSECPAEILDSSTPAEEPRPGPVRSLTDVATQTDDGAHIVAQLQERVRELETELVAARVCARLSNRRFSSPSIQRSASA